MRTNDKPIDNIDTGITVIDLLRDWQLLKMTANSVLAPRNMLQIFFIEHLSCRIKKKIIKSPERIPEKYKLRQKFIMSN